VPIDPVRGLMEIAEVRDPPSARSLSRGPHERVIGGEGPRGAAPIDRPQERRARNSRRRARAQRIGR
jgi:hypothetical protein